MVVGFESSCPVLMRHRHAIGPRISPRTLAHTCLRIQPGVRQGLLPAWLLRVIRKSEVRRRFGCSMLVLYCAELALRALPGRHRAVKPKPTPSGRTSRAYYKRRFQDTRKNREIARFGTAIFTEIAAEFSGKKKAWLGSHARTTTRRMEEPLPGAHRAVRKSFNFLSRD